MQSIQPSAVHAVAVGYVSANFCVLPIKPDGSKSPSLGEKWDEYQTRQPTDGELRNWFQEGFLDGVAIVGGMVSGGLGVIDVEYEDFWEAWSGIVEEQAPGLLARLPVVRSPGKDPTGGRHIYFRCIESVIATRKLASMTKAIAFARTGDEGRVTAIEIKGEGGYVLAPGCPAECHPSGRFYQHISGPAIADTPVITLDEAKVLISCAFALECGGDTVETVVGGTQPTGASDNGALDIRPGDDFNHKAIWNGILEPHGWVMVSQRGQAIYWRRPGKDSGMSATTGHCQSESTGDLLYVFSSNAAPFCDGKAYSKFAAHALLNHGGHWAEAATALARSGYGTRRQAHKLNGASTNGTSHKAPSFASEEDSEPIDLPSSPVPLEFPLEALPTMLASYATQIGVAMSCPPDFAAVAILGVAAAAIGASRSIEITRTWIEHPSIYLAIVADPGSAKSPVVDQVTLPLVEEQNRIYQDWLKLQEEYLDRKDAASKPRRRGANSTKEGEEEPASERPRRPIMRHLYTTDATTEVLVPILAENPRGLIMLRDEITAWVLSMNQYKGGKGADRQFYLSAWSGTASKTDRKSSREQGSIIVPRPFLCVLGSIQPDMLTELQDNKGREDGFIHRILFSFPVDHGWAEEIGEAPRCEEERYWEDVVKWLLNLTMTQREDGTFRSQRIRLDPNAREVARVWYKEHAQERKGADFPHGLVGPWSKLKSYYFRIMLILHVLRQACHETTSPEIDLDSAQNAACVMDYFKTHLRAVYSRLGQDQADTGAQKILAWIKRNGGKATARDLMRNHFAKKTSEAKEIMKDLKDRGHGGVRMEKASNNKNVETFYLHERKGDGNGS